MTLMVFKAQKPPEEAHPHLNGVNPGPGAAYAFHCGDGSAVHRTDGHQTGVGWVMSSDAEEKHRLIVANGKGDWTFTELLQWAKFERLFQALFAYTFYP